MSRNIPPLNPLRVFESVARLKSFSKAAEELFVSQSAVSRQIGLLEEYLGIQFFHRDRSGVRLTDAGQRYYQDIGPAFERIAAATKRLGIDKDVVYLRLRVYSTFAAKWLLRRMSDFQQTNPEVRLRIATAVAPADFSKEAVDASIQFGDGKWPGVDATYLFGDEIRPVCSPAFLKAHGPIRSPADILRCRLIHSHYRHDDWPDWFQSAGLSAPAEDEPLVLPSSLLAYQAAVDGLGIVMAQPRFLEAELDSGALLFVTNHVLHRDLAYYMVTPHGATNRAQVDIVRDWMLKAIAEGTEEQGQGQ
jgi:LysR family transcriptional regulator, glycine cleavage system transcriptional activator